MAPKHILRDIREFFKKQETIENEIKAGGKKFDSLNGKVEKLKKEYGTKGDKKTLEKIRSLKDDMFTKMENNSKKCKAWLKEKKLYEDGSNGDKLRTAEKNVERYENKVAAMNKVILDLSDWINQQDKVQTEIDNLEKEDTSFEKYKAKANVAKAEAKVYLEEAKSEVFSWKNNDDLKTILGMCRNNEQAKFTKSQKSLYEDLLNFKKINHLEKFEKLMEDSEKYLEENIKKANKSNSIKIKSIKEKKIIHYKEKVNYITEVIKELKDLKSSAEKEYRSLDIMTSYIK